MKNIKLSLFLVIVLFCLKSNILLAVGLIPEPTLNNVTVKSVAVFDNASSQYYYDYEIVNPANNTGEIWNLQLDIRYEFRNLQGLQLGNLFIPYGNNNTIPFIDFLNLRSPLNLPPGTSVVPIGQIAPTGWNGGFGRDGFLRFSTSSNGLHILPGTSMPGFRVISYRVPTIRTIRVVPNWALVVGNIDEVTDEQFDEAANIEQRIVYTTQTLGPSGVGEFGSDLHWEQFTQDVNDAISLGWILDSVLSQSIQSGIASAKQAVDQDDGTLAKKRLQDVLTIVNDSTNSQRNLDAYSLIKLNIENLITYTPDTPIPFEPVFSIAPVTESLQIGKTHELTARVVNSANNDAPVAGRFVQLYIVDGPHAGRNWYGQTEQNGEFKISYTGNKTGTDYIIWIEDLSFGREYERRPIQFAALEGSRSIVLAAVREYPDALAEASVTWTGGPDLVVPLFIPPEIKSKGDNTVFITEITENIGITPSIPSTTRYYISDTTPINPNTAILLGERRVGELLPNESTQPNTLQFKLPSNFQEKVYYLAACADANSEVTELDEENNCSFSQLLTSDSNVHPSFPIDNLPPDCSKANATPTLLWPPNHKFESVGIVGVIEPDNDPISIQILSVFQDEPVNSVADGNTAPDAIINGGNAQVRAERSGQLNGRVYVINFTASDGRGGSCSGEVTVGVPHDQGGQPYPINDGATYNSLAK